MFLPITEFDLIMFYYGEKSRQHLMFQSCNLLIVFRTDNGLFIGSIKIILYNWMFLHPLFLKYGPCQANLVLIAFASSKGSGEPAHPRSLPRTSTACSYKP